MHPFFIALYYKKSKRGLHSYRLQTHYNNIVSDVVLFLFNYLALTVSIYAHNGGHFAQCFGHCVYNGGRSEKRTILILPYTFLSYP